MTDGTSDVAPEHPTPALPIEIGTNEGKVEADAVIEIARQALGKFEMARTDVVNPVNGTAPYSYVEFHGQRIEFHDGEWDTMHQRDAGSGKAAAYAQRINDSLFALAKLAAQLRRESAPPTSDVVGLVERLRALVGVDGESICFGDRTCREIADDIKTAATALETLSAQVGRMEAALAFYADEARWVMNSAGVTSAMDDRGERARALLTKEPQ